MSDQQLVDLNSMVIVGEMFIEMQTASLNKINQWLRNPRSTFRHTRYKHQLEQWVMVASRNARVPPAKAKRVVRITRTYKSERYKLGVWLEPQGDYPDMLFDRQRDPLETENVIGRPEVAHAEQELRKAVRKWIVRTPVPSESSTGG